MVIIQSVLGLRTLGSYNSAVIPDYAQMRWIVRAPTVEELDAFVKRATNCLE